MPRPTGGNKAYKTNSTKQSKQVLTILHIRIENQRVTRFAVQNFFYKFISPSLRDTKRRFLDFHPEKCPGARPLSTQNGRRPTLKSACATQNLPKWTPSLAGEESTHRSVRKNRTNERWRMVWLLVMRLPGPWPPSASPVRAKCPWGLTGDRTNPACREGPEGYKFPRSGDAGDFGRDEASEGSGRNRKPYPQWLQGWERISYNAKNLPFGEASARGRARTGTSLKDTGF